MTETGLETQLLDQIASSLHELVRIARAISHSAIKDLLQATLDSEHKVLVYHLLDGTRTTKDIQQLTGVNVRYVSEWGQEWERIGIVESDPISGRKGRRRRVFDLSTFGIPFPEISEESESENNE